MIVDERTLARFRGADGYCRLRLDLDEIRGPTRYREVPQPNALPMILLLAENSD